MNTATGVVGIVMLAAGISGLRLGWRKLEGAHSRVEEDFLRILREKPGADLDSDTTFLSHRDSEKGWVVVLGLSLICIICGAGLALASFT